MQTPPVLEPTPSPSPVEIRQAHLNHEASVRSVGLLYYLAAFLSPVAAIAMFFENEPPSTATWLVSALLLVMAAVYLQLGRWVRRLNPKARTPATILSLIGLLGFPLGTLINIYVLYLLHSQKGRVVFSPGYAAVIEATPDVRYKTSVVTWILAGVLVLVLVVLLLAAAALRP